MPKNPQRFAHYGPMYKCILEFNKIIVNRNVRNVSVWIISSDTKWTNQKGNSIDRYWNDMSVVYQKFGLQDERQLSQDPWPVSSCCLVTSQVRPIIGFSVLVNLKRCFNPEWWQQFSEWPPIWTTLSRPKHSIHLIWHRGILNKITHVDM